MNGLQLMRLGAVLLLLVPATTIGGHVMGAEVNVVILECHVPTVEVEKAFRGRQWIEREPKQPPEVRLRAISWNATKAVVPMVTSNNSCAQALHEYLTAGFELERDVNLGRYIFLLTRKDNASDSQESQESHTHGD